MSRKRTTYSLEFKKQVTDDFYLNHLSLSECCKKWRIPFTTLSKWIKAFKSPEKAVTLPSKSIIMESQEEIIAHLRAENEHLTQKADYQRLSVAGYERLLEIIKQEDGIDLLKKGGAKQ